MNDGGDQRGGRAAADSPEPGPGSRGSAAALRALLPRTWYGFLARFSAPREIQRAAIPVLLEGGDALLVAPTAGGKTEAWAAPLAEQILARRAQGAADRGAVGASARPEGREAGARSAFVVCPTRALVNDLARRLDPPCAAVGLVVGRRTGEHRELGGARPPALVVTTPESLDSMLARAPGMLTGMRHLVLDEIHLLHASPRGDQLACLVARLRRIAPALQVVASSATVDDPDALARRYLAGEPHRIQVVAERAIRARIVRGGAGALHEALVRVAPQGVRKVLAFVPRRADAERLSGVFRGRPPFGEAVYLHHGSLSRARREAVERRMLTGDTGLCFATTTLEVGIDIGDIDLVVLTAPPPDVASLLQRLGRGNRRRADTRVVCLAAGDGEALRYEHLLAAARRGRLLADPRPFSPGVLVQQAFSLLHQSPGGWISAEALAERLPAGLADEPWQGRLPELLAHLAARGWLSGGPRRYGAGERLEEAFTRGRVHGNIDEEAGQVAVVDRDTRQVLGHVPRRSTREGRLRLGGRRLAITRAARSDRLVVTDTSGQADLEAGRAAGPLVPHDLARDLGRHLGIAAEHAPALRLRDGRWAVFHLLGGRWALALRALHAARPGAGVAQVTPFCAVTAGEPEAALPRLPAAELATILAERAGAVAPRLPLGPWARELPAAWRNEHVTRWWDPAGLAQALSRLEVVRDEDEGRGRDGPASTRSAHLPDSPAVPEARRAGLLGLVPREPV